MKFSAFFTMALAVAILAVVGVFGLRGGDTAHAQGAGPAPPTNVTATAAGSDVTVSWTNSPNAAGHLIFLFRSDFSGTPLTATPAGSPHTFNGVPDGSYIAIAVAFDANGDYNFAISGIVTVNASGPGGTPSPTPTPTPTPTPPPANQPPCPMPGSPAAAAPPPRPTSSTPGDYDADDDGLIEVANLDQLDAIRYDLSGRGTPSDDDLESYYTAFPNAVAGMGCPADGGCIGYELVADLDFGANPVNWLPIGRYHPETGNFEWGFGSTFEGNHHTISNLFIDRKDQDNVGLFGSAYGIIRNVGLVSVNTSGGNYVGGLVGGNPRFGSTTITGSYVTGAVSGKGTSSEYGDASNVGGLIGYGAYNITDSCAAANVSGGRNVGGLIGYGVRSITGSYATGDVSGGDNVGGLIGSGVSSITGSYATGAVSGSRGSAGGLVGGVDGRSIISISESYVTGTVSGGGSSVGGLIGSGGFNSSISESYVTGTVSGGGISVGGLIGSGGRDSSITDSYVTGAVSGDRDGVGGLVGRVDGESSISGSHVTGAVSGNGSSVGGLVGRVDGESSISESYATGAVSGVGYNVGGLVGLGSSHSSISESYATGVVSGGGGSVGGLVGSGYGSSITESYTTGDVSGGGDNVGGLVGSGGVIAGSYATGAVSGVGNSVGGLVGFSYDSITASYARGDVSGNFRVGGLVGLYHGGDGGGIVASYAIGSVTGKGALGGLIGSNTGEVTDSYWDTTASGAQHSDGGTGKTTAELQAPTSYTGIYANWNVDLDNADFDHNAATGGDDPWDFGTSSQYPVLKYGGLSVADQRGAASGGG